MTEATQKTGITGSVVAQRRDRFSKTFQNVLLVGSLCLLLLGGLGFIYLRAKSPLTLFSGSRRPIAAATAFVPKKAPFTFSLLTRPDDLIDLQQALVRPAWRAQARDEIDQIQQNLLSATGLSYERDIQPWLGSEITFTCTDLDIDQDRSNGAQPGYLLAFEIAPEQLPLAKSFLQVFWQQQALAGNPADVRQVNGVRILSGRSSGITTASAIVGEQFVMFASDVSVLRRSFQAAQTAQNLAQSADYRRQVDALPAERIGLAYFDAKLLAADLTAESASSGALSASNSTPDDPLDLEESSKLSVSKFVPTKPVVMSLGLTRNGLILNAESARTSQAGAAGAVPKNVRRALLRYLPITNELTTVGRDFGQQPSAGIETFLMSSSALTGASKEALGDASNSWLAFLRSGQTAWSNTSYALAKLALGRSSGWILTTQTNEALMDKLDAAAAAAGYSIVPIEIGDESATAWTRFKAGSRRGNGLETEVLGLHLQLHSQQGDVEILTDSLEAMKIAMKTALSAPGQSLLDSPQFVQAIAVLPEDRSGVVFADWSAVSPAIGRAFPAVNQFQSMIRPWLTYVGEIAAAFDQSSADIFIQLSARQPVQKSIQKPIQKPARAPL